MSQLKTYRSIIIMLSMFLLAGIISLNPVIAWSNNTFNNSLSNENLTFTGNQNITRYLLVPQNVKVINANINATLIYNNSNTNYCYQEYANVSTSCGGLSTGSYSYTGAYYEATDGNYATSTPGAGGGGVIFYVNYTKPLGASNNSLWQVKDGIGSANLSIPKSCWEAYTDKLVFRVYSQVGVSSDWICMNNTAENNLRHANSGDVYEEGMVWNISNYPKNVSIIINNSYNNYSYTSNSNLFNLPDKINSYLLGCTYLVGYCNVPIIFHSDSSGTLRYSDLLFSNIGFIENSQTYNSQVYETSQETFIINFTIDSQYYSATYARFIYNNTQYLATISGSGDNRIATAYLSIPTTSLELDNLFYWTIGLTNSSGTFYYNSSTKMQEVKNFNIYNCTSPSGLTLNFTVYDSNKVAINASFEASFSKIYSGNGQTYNTFFYDDLTNTKSNFMFCINYSIQDINFTINSLINYYSTDYTARNYILQGAIIGNFTQNIPLYLGLTNETSAIQFTVTDQNYNPISGALVNVQQWNVGTDTYSSMGMFTTSSEGTGTINLELYNVWYRAIVTLNGTILKVTDVQKVLPDSTGISRWNIIAPIGIDNPYNLFGTISHGLTFDNSTNITTFSWVDTSGYVQQGCLFIQNFTNLGYETISSSCTTSVAGTINYQFSQNGEYLIYGQIYLNSAYNISQITDSLNLRLGVPEITKTISPYGKFFSMVIIGTMGLIGAAAGSILLGIFLVVLSLWGLIKMGFINMSLGVLYGFIIILIVTLFRLSRR